MQRYRILFLALMFGTGRFLYPDDCCHPSVDCDASISGDCDEISNDCPTAISTYLNPRSITNDLTYRNSGTFFERFRGEVSCAFFTLDSTFLYQQNRKSAHLGRGFFGENPLLFAEQSAPFNSLNLGLGSKQPEGFSSMVRLSPKREVFAWLPQFIFNLDCFCPGTWADCAFAVTRVKHHICLFEQRTTFGDLTNEPSSVREALDTLEVFPLSRHHTGVDDIQVRLGYVMGYCEDDMFSVYLLGNIPTGKKFDDTRWFQPYVGSRRGGVGAGVMFDGNLWLSELDGTECLLMAELKYLYSFGDKQRRQFDLKNGPLSRFLLIAAEDNVDTPLQGGINLLRACAHLEPQHTLEWWLAFHYTWCCWGFEGGYNLWYRSAEKLTIKDSAFDFENFGIYDLTRCTDLTSHSTAKISDTFGQGTPDADFVKLTGSAVNRNSAISQKALSSTFSGTVTYATNWCDYPVNLAFGARYELASKHHASALENWGVYGKIAVSC